MTDRPTAPPQPVQPLDDQASTVGSVSQTASSDDARPVVTSVLPQALPQAVLQQPQDSLNPAHPTPSTIKEAGPVLTIDQVTELPPGVQSIEELRSPEISPEVEKFISEVKDNKDQLPEEVVIADQNTMPLVLPKTIAKPVIVLPMSEQELQKSHREPVTSSKRWFGEWVEKIIKVFNGEVVFRQDE